MGVAVVEVLHSLSLSFSHLVFRCYCWFTEQEISPGLSTDFCDDVGCCISVRVRVCWGELG